MYESEQVNRDSPSHKSQATWKQHQQQQQQQALETTSATLGSGGTESSASRGSSVSLPSDRYEAHLTNLQRSTRYTAYVRAFNSKGRGPPSEQVTVKTLDDVPPTAPSLFIEKTSPSSVTIAWNYLNSIQSTSNSVSQFILYYKKQHSPHGDWIERPISTKDTSYRVEQLDCGTSYEFYMTAHNSVGKSEPSSPVVGSTLGSSPVSPKSSDLLAKVYATECVLNLSTWRTNECPIKEFAVRIRVKSESAFKSEWILLTSKHSMSSTLSSSLHGDLPVNSQVSTSSSASSLLVLPSSVPSSSISLTTGSFSQSENYFFIRNLMPQSLYEIEVTARNQAGTTQAQYEFNTKSLGKYMPPCAFFLIFHVFNSPSSSEDR